VWPKNGGFWKMGVQTLDIGIATPPQGSYSRGTASFDVFCVKIGARLGGSLSQGPKK